MRRFIRDTDASLRIFHLRRDHQLPIGVAVLDQLLTFGKSLFWGRREQAADKAGGRYPACGPPVGQLEIEIAPGGVSH